jgi:hypothetical protein
VPAPDVVDPVVDRPAGVLPAVVVPAALPVGEGLADDVRAAAERGADDLAADTDPRNEQADSRRTARSAAAHARAAGRGKGVMTAG